MKNKTGKMEEKILFQTVYFRVAKSNKPFKNKIDKYPKNLANLKYKSVFCGVLGNCPIKELRDYRIVVFLGLLMFPGG